MRCERTFEISDSVIAWWSDSKRWRQWIVAVGLWTKPVISRCWSDATLSAGIGRGHSSLSSFDSGRRSLCSGLRLGSLGDYQGRWLSWWMTCCRDGVWARLHLLRPYPRFVGCRWGRQDLRLGQVIGSSLLCLAFLGCLSYRFGCHQGVFDHHQVRSTLSLISCLFRIACVMSLNFSCHHHLKLHLT